MDSNKQSCFIFNTFLGRIDCLPTSQSLFKLTYPSLTPVHLPIGLNMMMKVIDASRDVQAISTLTPSYAFVGEYQSFPQNPSRFP